MLKLLYLKIVIQSMETAPSMACIKKAVPKADGIFTRILCEKIDFTLFVLLAIDWGGHIMHAA